MALRPSYPELYPKYANPNLMLCVPLLYHFVDIDECEEGACYGSIRDCINTPGSYTCLNQCASGYEMVDGECVGMLHLVSS